MIKYDETFEFERDRYNWHLHTWRDGINPKTKKPTRVKHTTYRPSINYVLRAILDVSVGECKDLKQILEKQEEVLLKIGEMEFPK